MEKDILVFDTNIILELKSKFDKTILNLQKKFDVFIPQFCICERISQQERDILERFKEVEELNLKYNDIIKNIYLFSKEQIVKKRTKVTEEAYTKLFPDHIIPFTESLGIYRDALSRSMKRLPPFNKDKNASDKGYKDCLLWLSLIEFFKSFDTTQKVIFITKDNGFLNTASELEKEFQEKTKLYLTIQKELPTDNQNSVSLIEDKNGEIVQDIDAFRIRLNEAMNLFCKIEIQDYYGNCNQVDTFKINNEINANDAKCIVEGLIKLLRDYALSYSLKPSTIFGSAYIVRDDHPISMDCLEKIVALYKDIEFNEELQSAFFNEIANRINQNYYNFYIDDDLLPF